MSRVASVLIDDRTVTVSLSAAEKIEALHGNVTVPRAAVVLDLAGQSHDRIVVTAGNPEEIVSRLR